MKYFSYDPEDNIFELHDTAEAAQKQAQVYIQYYLKDGWDELVEQVCWGEIKEIAKKTNIRTDETGEFNYICDYDLKPVKD